MKTKTFIIEVLKLIPMILFSLAFLVLILKIK